MRYADTGKDARATPAECLGHGAGATSSPLAKIAVIQAVYLEERAWRWSNRGMGILAHGRFTPDPGGDSEDG